MILYLKNKDTGQWESVPALVGPPGETPYIGANGHWWIGETDTGVPARGEGSGDMLVATYDADGSVAAAGGIKQYVAAHGGSSEGGSTDLTGYAKETWVAENYQPKGEYLTEVPEGYAKTADIPTSLSQLSPDANNQRVAAHEKAYWNNKSDFSGSYNDLTDKPAIPNGDMMASAYDPYGTVAAAGGIVDYVAEHAGGADQTVEEGTGTATATSSTHAVLSTSSVTWKKVGNLCFVKCDLEISPASNGYQYYTINLTGLPISQEGVMIGKVNYCVASYTRSPTQEQLTTNGSGITLQLGFDAAITSNLELEYSIIGYAE